MSALAYDVSHILGRPGASLAIRRAVPLPGVQSPLGWIGEDETVTLDLAADAVPDGIAVSGTVSGTLHLACSRCLAAYDQPFEQLIDELFVEPDDGVAGGWDPDDDRDVYEVRDNHIDLEPMLRDVVMLAIPSRPLHDEGCRGLCSTCGGDMNVADCGHTQQPEDLRWAPLRGVLDRLERST